MTTVKNNSVRLFEQVKANGALYGIALDVFGIVCKTPGLTGGEIFSQYERNKPLEAAGRSRNEIAKRVSDLANWGAIKADGVTICPESGRKATRWVPTGQAPVAKKDRRLASVPREKVVVMGDMHMASSPRDLAGAVQGLGRILGRNISASAAELLIGQAKELVGEGFNVKEMKAQIASAKNAEKVAYDSRNAAQARCNAAEAELERLKSGAVSIEGNWERYLLKVSEEKGLSTSKVIELALTTYSQVDSGKLVPVSTQPKRAPVAPGTVAQLQALASRTRAVLKFKFFLSKAYRAQAEKTLAALESAINSL